MALRLNLVAEGVNRKEHDADTWMRQRDPPLQERQERRVMQVPGAEHVAIVNNRMIRKSFVRRAELPGTKKQPSGVASGGAAL